MTIFKKQLDSNSYGKWKQNGDFGDTQSQKMQRKTKTIIYQPQGENQRGVKSWLSEKTLRKLS